MDEASKSDVLLRHVRGLSSKELDDVATSIKVSVCCASRTQPDNLDLVTNIGSHIIGNSSSVASS